MAYIGPALERLHGSCKVGLVFFAAGGAANLLSAVYAHFSISVGASGGICAWIGFAVADYLIHWPLLKVLHKAGAGVISFPFFKTKLWIAFEMLLMIIVGLLPWIDNFAHLGGLFFGMCIGQHDHSRGCSAALGLQDQPFLPLPPVQVANRCYLLDTRALCDQRALAVPEPGYRRLALPQLSLLLGLCTAAVVQKVCDPCYYINEVYTTHTLDGRLGLELTCPYGNLGYVVVAEWPTKRGEWADFCHEHCEL